MSKGWDNATLKKLKALTGKGLSTSEIGKRLGMSKNAIVGKLNRLGWNAKAAAAATPAPEKKSVAKKIVERVTGTKKTADAPKETMSAKKIVAAPKKTPKAVKETKAAPKKATPAKKIVTEPKKAASKSTGGASAKNLAMHQRIIQHSLEMANLKPNQCRWPIGDPDSEHFHFCGETVFVGKPYCYEHCKQAYQFTPPKKK